MSVWKNCSPFCITTWIPERCTWGLPWQCHKTKLAHKYHWWIEKLTSFPLFMPFVHSCYNSTSLSHSVLMGSPPFLFQINSLACRGQYVTSGKTDTAATQSLFTASYTYWKHRNLHLSCPSPQGGRCSEMKEKQRNLISLSLNKTGNGLVYSPTLASTIYKGDILFFTYAFKKHNSFHARNN